MESPHSQSDIELSKKLIQLVKDKPFLYDKDLEDYKNETKKTETWKQIGEALNLGVDETQIRWSRLRVDFGRHRRKRQASEACGAPIREWQLYNSLTWLAPHVKMRAKRGKRKSYKTQESHNFKPILPRPHWLVNVDGGVSVDVNPNIVVQNGHEDITESYIVSPDTADHEDDASLENGDHSYSSNGHMADSHCGQLNSPEEEDEDNLFCRSICASFKRFTYQQKALAKIRIQQLSQADIRLFVNQHELELSNFMAEARAALGDNTKSGNFTYSLDSKYFCWKRSLSNGLIAKLGQVGIKEVPALESYDALVDKLLDIKSNFLEKESKMKSQLDAREKDSKTALDKLKEFAIMKEEWEKDLYGRFVVVLNAKKERIQILEEQLELNFAEQGGPGQKDDGPEVKSESEEGDPYAGDTDVDTDGGDEEKSRSPSPSSPTPSTSTARRRRGDIFDSFESPDSPLPILPKRARMPAKESTTAISVDSSSASVSAAGPSSAAFPPSPPPQGPSPAPPLLQAQSAAEAEEPLEFGENTQDLLDEF